MRSSFASISVVASRWRGEFTEGWPGVLMSVVIAVAATFIADHRGGPTLLYALLLGMALNSVATEGRAKPGVDIAARRILRVGVALLGARITFEQIGGLGWFNGGLMIAGVVLTIAFGVGAAKALGLSRRLGVLTGGATAICGASAAIAIATILPRDEPMPLPTKRKAWQKSLNAAAERDALESHFRDQLRMLVAADFFESERGEKPRSPYVLSHQKWPDAEVLDTELLGRDKWGYSLWSAADCCQASALPSSGKRRVGTPGRATRR